MQGFFGIKLSSGVKFKKRLGRAFVDNENGGMAVPFAITVTMLLTLGGVAVDYNMATNLRTKMQNASDAAALAAGKEYQTNNDSAHLSEVAKKAYEENMALSGYVVNVDEDASSDDSSDTPSGAISGNFNADYTERGYRVAVQSVMKTSFMGMFGKKNLPVGVASEVNLGGNSSNLEVALVYHLSRTVDIGALKESSYDLVDELMDDNDSVKVSLVPFYKYVNIGKPASQPSWLVRTGFSNSPSSYSSWKGCAGTRAGGVNETNSYAVRDDGYFGNNKARAVNERNQYCSHTMSMTPLTSSKATIENAIKNMVKSPAAWDDHFTHFPVGLVWGWASLSSTAPFTQALPYSDENKKVLIFVTDSRNNRGMYNGHAGSWRKPANGGESAANAEASALCHNMEKEGITIFTVRINETNSELKEVMEDCAVNGGDHYYVETGADDDLEEVFEDITDEIKSMGGDSDGNLRLIR